MRVGGQVVASTAVDVHDVSAPKGLLLVGGNGGSNGSQAVAGSIAAIVAVHAPAGTSIDDGEAAAVEGCLRTMYGL